MEIAGSVVPPRVPAGFRVMQSVRIDESRARKLRECLPLWLGHVRTAMTGARVPHIDIFWRYIEITADDGRCARSDGLVDPASQPVKPHELGFIERRAHEPPVRRVHTDHAHAAAFSSE